MNWPRLTPWLIGGALIILIGGASGWVLGAGVARGTSDARQAREQGFEAGFELAFQEARQVTVRQGLKDGALRGKRAGGKTGSREGGVIGAGNSEIEEVVASQKSAEASEAVAESEIASRSANCGVVAAAPSWCPTGDELSAYQKAVRVARRAAEEKQEEEDERAADDRP